MKRNFKVGNLESSDICRFGVFPFRAQECMMQKGRWLDIQQGYAMEYYDVRQFWLVDSEGSGYGRMVLRGNSKQRRQKRRAMIRAINNLRWSDQC